MGSSDLLAEFGDFTSAVAPTPVAQNQSSSSDLFGAMSQPAPAANATNFGADNTKIYYIGLAGEFTQVNRVGVVNAVYEARAIPGDHKQKEEDGGVSSFGGGGGPAF